MKKVTALLLAFLLCFAISACGSGKEEETISKINLEHEARTEAVSKAQKTEESSMPQTEETDIFEETESNTVKILTVYFSRTGENYGVGHIEKGNTSIIADMIAEQLDTDLFEISTVTPYPDGYDDCTKSAKQEQEENARPKLTASVENISDYDVIFIGYPIWWSDMPMAIYTFLESYDFSGKTIIPFCTHEGSGLSSTESSIAEICKGAEVLTGFELKGSVAQNSREQALEAVISWLNQIEIPTQK